MRSTLPARSAVQAVTQFPPFQFLGRTAIVRRILGWRPSLRLDQSPGPLEAGIAAGVLAVCVSHPVLAVLGTSLPVTTGLLLAVALAVQLGWSSAAGMGSVSAETGEPQGLRDFAGEFLLTGVALFALALPWLAEAAARVIGRMSLPSLAQTGGALLLAYVGGSVLAGVPAMALAAAVGRAAGRRRDPQGGGVRAMAGFAAGLMLMAVLAGPLAGIQPVAAVLCLLLVVRLGLHSAAYSGLLPGWQSADESPTDAEVYHAECPAAAVNGPAPTVAARGWTLAATFWMGCVAAVLARGVFQLMPATFSVRIMFWAGLAGGCAAGWQLARRSRFRPVQAGVVACLLAGTWLAVLTAGFPQAVQVQLWFNAHVSYAWLQLGLRAGTVWLTSLPVGVACGLLWTMVARKAAAAGRTTDDFQADNLQADGAEAAGPLLPGCQALALLAGMCSVWWFGFRWLSAGSMAATLLPAGLILGGIGVLLQRVARGSFDAESQIAQQPGGPTTAGSRFPRFARYLAPGSMAVAVIVMLLGPVWQHRADPALAAQLLFSTRVFLASRGDLPPAMLPHLDETRLVDQTEGDNGTLSLWSMRGVQLQLRDGGVPKSAVSRNPAVCPQFAAEVMQMALPLAMHESPHNVLLLGAGTGAGVHAGLAFPVKQLVCVEGDRGLHTLLNRSVWPKLQEDPRQDDRLAMVSLDPALAVRTASGQYDVVISSPDQTSLHQSLAYSSPGFYRAAAAQLNEDGIFCQRVQHMDFGPEAVASLVRSVMSVFTDVAAVATAPGEWTLLATRSAKGLNREGLDDRLQKRHVRRVLAELGWDWTVPLNLQGFDQAGLEGFVQQQRSTGGLIRADRLAFALPVDVLRWSPKQQQLAAALGPHAGRLLAWSSVDAEDPDLLRRLAEVAGHRELIVRYPDQKWAYRKSLRDQMTEERKSSIQQVGYETGGERLHTQDRQRMEYLKVLGRAVENPQLSGEDIQQIIRLSQPYDPLMTYFAHEEAAVLCRRLGGKAAGLELEHRLHLEFYTDARDRSVRNAARSLDILCRHPETVPDPAERRDMINALLQVLKQRWEMRGLGVPKSTRIVLNDLSRSVAAVELAFETLDELTATEPSLDQQDWQQRRAFLDRAVLRPLRTYRSRLLPHHMKHEQTMRQLLQPEIELQTDGEPAEAEDPNETRITPAGKEG